MTARLAGRVVLLGHARLMAEHGVALEGLAKEAERLEAEGKTPVFVAVDREARGLLAVADVPEARGARRRSRPSAGSASRSSC